MRETVLQFGTGNFLRAFIDPFLDILRQQGLYDGAAVIVSPTNSAAVERLNAQNCAYHLLLRGMVNGEQAADLTEIHSVTRAVNPYREFDAFLALAGQPDLRFIVSNTTEAGIAFDESCRFGDRPQASFPGKLTRFLYERYQKGLPGFVLLPCELIDDNGTLLKKYVKQYAELWALPPAFFSWLEEENTFCNTLVDRIVTGFPKADADAWFEKLGCADLLLDAAEPYHLWVIEGDFEKELPLKQAGVNVIWTNDVRPYKKMKVRILNGLHTSMVFLGLQMGLETVADCMNDPLLSVYLSRLLQEEILPTLDGSAAVLDFAAAVEQRFKNPFLRHRLESISLNSLSKYRVRVLPTLFDRTAVRGETPKVFALSLAALLCYYKTRAPQDDPALVSFIKQNDLPAVLANADLWGTDLSFLLPQVEACMNKMEDDGVREAIQWSLT